jgi:hypothetical protein
VGVAAAGRAARGPCNQALALTRCWRRHASQLRFGVRRGERRLPLVAHAWVECEGEPVVGNADSLDRFAPLGSA